MASSISKSIKRKLLEQSDPTKDFAFPKRQKFNNEPTGNNASKLEAEVAAWYYQNKKSGKLSDVEEQVHVPVCGPWGHECRSECRVIYIVDFRLTRLDGSVFYGEAKGKQTAPYRIKRRLWIHHSLGMLEVWGGRWQKPLIIEVIGDK